MTEPHARPSSAARRSPAPSCRRRAWSLRRGGRDRSRAAARAVPPRHDEPERRPVGEGSDLVVESEHVDSPQVRSGEGADGHGDAEAEATIPRRSQPEGTGRAAPRSSAREARLAETATSPMPVMPSQPTRTRRSRAARSPHGAGRSPPSRTSEGWGQGMIPAETPTPTSPRRPPPGSGGAVRMVVMVMVVVVVVVAVRCECAARAPSPPFDGAGRRPRRRPRGERHEVQPGLGPPGPRTRRAQACETEAKTPNGVGQSYDPAEREGVPGLAARAHEVRGHDRLAVTGTRAWAAPQNAARTRESSTKPRPRSSRLDERGEAALRRRDGPQRVVSDSGPRGGAGGRPGVTIAVALVTSSGLWRRSWGRHAGGRSRHSGDARPQGSAVSGRSARPPVQPRRPAKFGRDTRDAGGGRRRGGPP